MKDTKTLKEILKDKNSNQNNEDFVHATTVPAGQEWPGTPTTLVIQKTVVVHENAPKKKLKQSKMIARFFLDGNHLYKEHKKSLTKDIPDSLAELLSLLAKSNHEFVPLSHCKEKCNYASVYTFKSQLRRLHIWMRDTHKISFNVIEGKSGSGYRLHPSISIQRIRPGTK